MFVIVSWYGCNPSADPNGRGDLSVGLDGRGQHAADRSQLPGPALTSATGFSIFAKSNTSLVRSGVNVLAARSPVLDQVCVIFFEESTKPCFRLDRRKASISVRASDRPPRPASRDSQESMWDHCASRQSGSWKRPLIPLHCSATLPRSYG